MVGQGVLRECLLDPRVQRVLAVGRASTGRRRMMRAIDRSTFHRMF
jgi:hypothetical protein